MGLLYIIILVLFFIINDWIYYKKRGNLIYNDDYCIWNALTMGTYLYMLGLIILIIVTILN